MVEGLQEIVYLSIFIKIGRADKKILLPYRLNIYMRECCVSRHENNINLVVHLHQSSWIIRYLVNEQSYFERNILL